VGTTRAILQMPDGQLLVAEDGGKPDLAESIYPSVALWGWPPDAGRGFLAPRASSAEA